MWGLPGDAVFSWSGGTSKVRLQANPAGALWAILAAVPDHGWCFQHLSSGRLGGSGPRMALPYPVFRLRGATALASYFPTR